MNKETVEILTITVDSAIAILIIKTTGWPWNLFGWGMVGMIFIIIFQKQMSAYFQWRTKKLNQKSK